MQTQWYKLSIVRDSFGKKNLCDKSCKAKEECDLCDKEAKDKRDTDLHISCKSQDKMIQGFVFKDG